MIIIFNLQLVQFLNRIITKAMSSDLALRIVKLASKDEVKVYKKKIQILKDAVKTERKNNEGLQKNIHEQKERSWKLQSELKKKEEKNEILLVEIRQLKDALVVQRNQKQKILQQLQSLKRTQSMAQQQAAGRQQSQHQGALGGYFSSLWKK